MFDLMKIWFKNGAEADVKYMGIAIPTWNDIDSVSRPLALCEKKSSNGDYANPSAVNMVGMDKNYYYLKKSKIRWSWGDWYIHVKLTQRDIQMLLYNYCYENGLDEYPEVVQFHWIAFDRRKHKVGVIETMDIDVMEAVNSKKGISLRYTTS